MAADGDRLAQINDELRATADLQQTPWLPLESNPAVLNAFAKRTGLPEGWHFVDVPSLEPELLSFFLPQPCAAFILLFPCTPDIYRFRREEEKSTRALAAKGEGPPESVFFLQQHSCFGNACGTIASVHALSNLSHIISLDQGKEMAKFVEANETKSPDARGEALFKCQGLKESSDTAAVNREAQTVCPARDGPSLDHHFVAFVFADGKLVELDGTKWAPVSHGLSSPQTFVADVAKVVRTNFMQVQPDSIEFNLVALTKCS